MQFDLYIASMECQGGYALKATFVHATKLYEQMLHGVLSFECNMLQHVATCCIQIFLKPEDPSSLIRHCLHKASSIL